MIRLIMAFSLIGTIALIAVCAPLSKTAKIPIPQNHIVIMQFDTEKGIDEMEGTYMQESAVKDMFRGEIVGKSIQILRSHGKSDEEIKEIFLIATASIPYLLSFTVAQNQSRRFVVAYAEWSEM